MFCVLLYHFAVQRYCGFVVLLLDMYDVTGMAHVSINREKCQAIQNGREGNGACIVGLDLTNYRWDTIPCLKNCCLAARSAASGAGIGVLGPAGLCRLPSPLLFGIGAPPLLRAGLRKQQHAHDVITLERADVSINRPGIGGDWRATAAGQATYGTRFDTRRGLLVVWHGVQYI